MSRRSLKRLTDSSWSHHHLHSSREHGRKGWGRGRQTLGILQRFIWDSSASVCIKLNIVVNPAFFNFLFSSTTKTKNKKTKDKKTNKPTNQTKQNKKLQQAKAFQIQRYYINYYYVNSECDLI